MTTSVAVSDWLVEHGSVLESIRLMPDGGRRVLFVLQSGRRLEAAVEKAAWESGLPSVTNVLDAVCASQNRKEGSHAPKWSRPSF